VWRHDGQALLRLAFDPGVALTSGADAVFVAGKLDGAAAGLLCDTARLDPQAAPARAETGVPAACLRLGNPGTIHRASFSPDGGTLALSLRAGEDNRPDSGEFALLQRRDAWRLQRAQSAGRVDALAFTRDSRWLAVGGRRGLTLWRTEDSVAAVALPTPSPVTQIAPVQTDAGTPKMMSLDGLTPSILRIWDGDADAFLRRGCRRLPPERPMPRQTGVPDLPARGQICQAREPGPEAEADASAARAKP